MPILVVRHARAGRRSAYHGDDRNRPLTARGRAQADALVGLLSGYRPRRILSSPYVRCCETVRPLSEALDLPVESVEELGEGHGPAALALLERMAGESAVLCTHRDISTALLAVLADGATAKERQALRLQKAEAWVVQSTGARMTIVDHLRPVVPP